MKNVVSRANKIPSAGATQISLAQVTITQPKLSHLQGYVLRCLRAGPLKGVLIRQALSTVGRPMEGPKFYQLMARICRAGWALEKKEQRIEEGQLKRESVYTLTIQGQHELECLFRFYRIGGRQERIK